MNDQPSRDAAAVPIVVPNTLWQAADPEAYDGGQPSDITHLAEFEASGLGRRDDARWSGALEVIPTKADVVLDLIRVSSLWRLLSGLVCCAIEMISAATSRNDSFDDARIRPAGIEPVAVGGDTTPVTQFVTLNCGG